MDKRGGGSIKISFENFGLTVPKSFVGEPLCAVFQKTSGCQMFMAKRGGSIKISFENFGLTVPKSFVGEPLCAVFQKTSGCQMFMAKRGGEYQDFLRKFLSHSAEKFRRGTL